MKPNKYGISFKYIKLTFKKYENLKSSEFSNFYSVSKLKLLRETLIKEKLFKNNFFQK
jgi:hypothetical protein